MLMSKFNLICKFINKNIIAKKMGWKKVSKRNGLIDTPIPTIECIIALKI